MNDEIKVEYSDSTECEKRKREIQYLINIVQPDPEYQPFFISDKSAFFDLTSDPEKIIVSRLELYLGFSLPFSLTTPLWKAVDILKEKDPEWPEQ